MVSKRYSNMWRHLFNFNLADHILFTCIANVAAPLVIQTFVTSNIIVLYKNNFICHNKLWVFVSCEEHDCVRVRVRVTLFATQHVQEQT